MKQVEALAILKDEGHVFLTGAAGSGKTYVLRQFIDYLKTKGKSVGVTASTGIASTHIHGSTIHSWAGFGIRDRLSEYDIDALSQKENLVKRYNATDVLIIDEVSMLHAHQLDFVDRIARALRQSNEPFGGIQVVLCGDLFQLPPVSRDGKSAFVIRSKAWRETLFQMCYLDEQHRQDDDTLLNILNDIRNDRVDEETKMPLRDRYRQPIKSGHTPTKLYTHNVDVDRINDEMIAKIDGAPRVYEMVTRGSKKRVESLVSSCLAPERLSLKKGAVVMFIKNAQDKRYANGTLGVVEDFDEDTGLPNVRTYRGKLITAYQETWRIDEDGKVKAELAQVPLRLAWAITVHKSQGMSLDAAEIDLSKSFTPGMGYVALSRVRTLAGLSLVGMNELGFKVHPEVLLIDKELKQASDALRPLAQELMKKYKSKKEKSHSTKPASPAGRAPRDKAEKSDGPIELKKKGYSVAEIREIYPNAYKKWSKEEEEQLKKAFNKNKDLKQLGQTFGRGTGGVHSRLIQLGLIEE